MRKVMHGKVPKSLGGSRSILLKVVFVWFTICILGKKAHRDIEITEDHGQKWDRENMRGSV
jgi:hypothetical protein